MSTVTSFKPSEIDLMAKYEFGSGWDTYTLVCPQFFNTDVPDRLNERESVVATDSNIPEMSESEVYSESNVKEIGYQTYTTKKYGKKIGITDMMRAFSNYGTVMKEMRRLGLMAKYKQDELMSAVLSGAFTTTKTFDGKALIASDHIQGQGAEVTSNLLTGALSETTINNAYIKLGQMKDHSGMIMTLSTANLIVPRALHMTAWEKINSTIGPDTNNKRNFVNSLGINIIVNPLLDQVSTSAWFMTAPKGYTGLRAYQKEVPTLKGYFDEATDTQFEKVKFMQTQGATDYFGITGSTGA